MQKLRFIHQIFRMIYSIFLIDRFIVGWFAAHQGRAEGPKPAISAPENKNRWEAKG
jgi:hypothetical protein